MCPRKQKRVARRLWTAACLVLIPASALAAEEANREADPNRPDRSMAAIVAVDNVCAWPNLTVLGDGTIVAMIHNQPSHLKRPGDLECWASTDGGRTWAKRGVPGPRDNDRAARANAAAGTAGDGNLVVIVSGWSDPAAASRGTILPSLVCRSADGGKTWTRDANAFKAPWPKQGRTKASPDGCLMPFGDILRGQDGTMRAGFYGADKGGGFIYRSRDDGRTWGESVAIDPRAVVHEPALLNLGKGRWLLAARNDGLTLYTSRDDGNTWMRGQRLTGPQQHPGHFTRLADGRVLLSYGNRRTPQGIDVRLSDDAGASWGKPFRVAAFEGDGGYPSSVQLADGRILTAYYARRVGEHDRYHMAVAIWIPPPGRQHIPHVLPRVALRHRDAEGAPPACNLLRPKRRRDPLEAHGCQARAHRRGIRLAEPRLLRPAHPGYRP